ncbi:MAG: hypothetical protein PHT94_00005 [Candidatus Nanoarchaeia archaeon]|nr:hypothetical protein [Candidatus Nanoarchaeia archaeon]
MFFSVGISKNKFDEFQKKIKESFNKIKYEISLSYKWIANLNVRVKNLELNNLMQIDDKIKELENNNKEIFLENNKLREYNKIMYQKMEEVVRYLNFVDQKVKKIDELELIKKDFDFNIENISRGIMNLENKIELQNKLIKNEENLSERNNSEDKINELKELYVKSFKKVYQVLEKQNQNISELNEKELKKIDELKKIEEMKLSFEDKNKSLSLNKIESKKENDESFENSYMIKKGLMFNNSNNNNNNNNDVKYKENNLNIIDGKLSKSEKKLLYVLLNSNVSLSYSDISRGSNLNYGTIKNNMYNLRKKGMEIPYIMNDKREKLYYLNEELILKITGR